VRRARAPAAKLSPSCQTSFGSIRTIASDANLTTKALTLLDRGRRPCKAIMSFARIAIPKRKW
jgi:hypothetical protein